MRNTLLIARREYLAHVRTRSFLLTVLCAPLLVAGAIFFPGLSLSLPVVPIALVDQPGTLHPLLRERLEAQARQGGQRIYLVPGLLFRNPQRPDVALRAANQALEDGRCRAVLHLPARVQEGQPAILRIPSGEPVPTGLVDALEAALVGALWQASEEEARLPGLQVAQLEGRRTGTGTGAIMLALIFIVMLYVTIFGMSHALLTSVIEEKTSRVVELLLSSATSRQLMGGKILGLGAVGLTLALLWGAGGVVVSWTSDQLPEVSPFLLGSFLLYFCLGFLLHAALLVGIGAMVNSLRESYHLVAPITLLMVLPALLWWNVTVAPSGVLARVLSWIPFTTPMAMLIRVASPMPPGIWEVLGTGAVMLISILLAMRLAARLFDVGMLMRGGTPGVGTLVRLATGRLPTVRVGGPR